jgi:chorismate mutase
MDDRTNMEDGSNPDSLDALRLEIDRLDDALLDLVEQRLAASLAIAELKKAEAGNCLNMRPRREQAVIERLIGQARTAPPEVIARIWRTIMSYSLQAQGRIELILCSDGDKAALLQQVRNRFGDGAPLRWVDNAEEALDESRSANAVAVVSPGLLNPDEVESGLPGFDLIRSPDGTILAVAIGRVGPEEALDFNLVRQALADNIRAERIPA